MILKFLQQWWQFEKIRQYFFIRMRRHVHYLGNELNNQDKPSNLDKGADEIKKKLDELSKKMSSSNENKAKSLRRELALIKKEVENLASGNALYYFYCWNKFHMAINSFYACRILIKKKYYYESSFIIRNLLEGIIEIKYLKKHKKKSANYWVGNNGGWKHMFNEVVPDLYKIHYSSTSATTHGNVLSMMYFIVFKDDLFNANIDHKHPYVEARGSIISIYYLTILYLAYLNEFSEIFKISKERDKRRIVSRTREIYYGIERLELATDSNKMFKNKKWKSTIKKLIPARKLK